MTTLIVRVAVPTVRREGAVRILFVAAHIKSFIPEISGTEKPMDFMLLNAADPDSVTDEFLQLIVATASGRPARNELNEQREIAIWKDGVTL